MKQKLPKQVLILFFSGIILLLTQTTGSAQEEASSPCAVNLQNAQSAFDRGQVEQVPTLLGECLKSGFTKEEQLTAYKLIIQTLLFQDKLAEADSAMLAFLKKNPEYELSPTDHSSFVTLYNTFQVKPVVQVSLHLGTNVPYITFIDENTTSSETADRKYSSPVINFYGSVEIKIKLNQHFDISVEPALSQIRFRNVERFEDILHSTTYYDEAQTRIELPVSASYNFKSFGKFTPFARLGAGPSLILSVNGTAETIPQDLNNPNDLPAFQSDRDESRIDLDFFTQIGGGIKYKTRGGYFFTEVRTNIGLRNMMIPGGDDKMELDSHYFYSDDDVFHLNTLNLNLGYTLIFYKPSKLK